MVLSADGSLLELLNSEEVNEYYGLQKAKEESVGRIMGRCFEIYDSLNEIMIIIRIDSYKVSEKVQIEEELKSYIKVKK